MQGNELNQGERRPDWIEDDPYLAPYRGQLAERSQRLQAEQQRLVGGTTLLEFAGAYHYYGLHTTADGWVLREWAPAATAIYLVCDANDWRDDKRYQFHPARGRDSGDWELTIPAQALHHGSSYRLHVHWPGGSGYRIPAYADYVVQDPSTHSFDARVYQPPHPYQWRHTRPPARRGDEPLRIYEAHVGMSTAAPTVASYQDFTNLLPRITGLGYNAIQLMAIAEHPYYASFGYQVSNFFAPSSRFGTPDDLRALIDAAHGHGLLVIMDLVHSHASKNPTEGLVDIAGQQAQYFYPGSKGHHPQWDSRCFDYTQPKVLEFLLSNCRYWLEEFQFDGFRFDGVTSMLYDHHGLGKDFTSYSDYFSPHTHQAALTYLALANQLIHQVLPGAITIAEDTSGMPGLAAPVEEPGGIGFDYRLSMGVPDMWIRLLEEVPDEAWPLGDILHQLTQHRAEERTISYAESHDQALVGDKTISFRLMGSLMYTHMHTSMRHPRIERGLALHTIIRLLTASTNHGGTLTFMGNEFGHPEWIDFPRQGNDWSYHYARRQWHLADDDELYYAALQRFEQRMNTWLAQLPPHTPITHQAVNQADGTISYQRGPYLLAYNLSPQQSLVDYSVPARPGQYQVVFSTDDEAFAGQQRISHTVTHHTQTAADGSASVQLYLPARTGVVLRRLGAEK